MQISESRFSIYVNPSERQQMIADNAKRGLECVKVTVLNEKKVCLTFQKVMNK